MIWETKNGKLEGIPTPGDFIQADDLLFEVKGYIAPGKGKRTVRLILQENITLNIAYWIFSIA